jgi:hypothetical protein
LEGPVRSRYPVRPNPSHEIPSSSGDDGLDLVDQTRHMLCLQPMLIGICRQKKGMKKNDEEKQTKCE